MIFKNLFKKLKGNIEVAPVDDDKAVADDLYAHIKNIAQFKYESELRREDSLIQQSGHMQTGFALMSAAVLMVMPFVYEYRDAIPLNFLHSVFVTIFLFLLLSLAFASIAQYRWKMKYPASIRELESEIIEGYKELLTSASRDKQWVGQYADLQESKTKTNELRVKLVMFSMWSFYIALAVIALSFIIGFGMQVWWL